MRLIHVIRTGNEQLVKCALYCGAKINNSDTIFENTLFQALFFYTNNKFSPKIIQILLDNGAKMPKYCGTLSRAIEFTNEYLKAPSVIKFKSNSEKEKVNQIFQIIDLAIGYEIPNKVYLNDLTWYYSIMLAKNCINHLENGSHHFVFRLFDELIRLNIKPDNRQMWANTLSTFIEHLILTIDNKKKVSDELILKLLDRLIRVGAMPNEESSEFNTLGLAIQTKNIKIIKIITSIVSKPDVSDTQYNSLNLAVKTLDREIIEEIIMIGGRPSNEPNSCTFNVSARAITDHEIFDTLICIGMTIPENFISSMIRRHQLGLDHSFKLAFYSCGGLNDFPSDNIYSCGGLNDFPSDKMGANELKLFEIIDDMYNHCNFYNRYYIDSKFEQRMISRIQNNMNRLVGKYSDRFLKKNNLDKTLTFLPENLNGIIYEYYYNQTIVVIDWIKMFDTLAANLDNMQGTLNLSKRLNQILSSFFSE